MSGPGTPAQNILRMPLGQTKKPMGDTRPPGVLPPGQSSEPIQRSDASRRILAARQAGVQPEQLTQQPGYRPKGDRAPIPQAPQRPAPAAPAAAPAPAPAASPQPQSQAAPVQPSTPMPRPRPEGAPGPQYTPSPVASESQRRAAAVAEVIRAEAEGRPPIPYSTGGWGQPTTKRFPEQGAPPIAGVPQAQASPGAISPQDFVRQAQEMQARNQQPGVREATPDEIKAAQKNEMAKSIAAKRSGGEGPSASAPQGAVVTPPASSPAVSPPQAPPPAQGYKPITGPNSEYVVRAPELEGKEGKKLKPAKSTQKSSDAFGSNPRYYAILGVAPGDNVGAARALSKLEEKMRTNPGDITREQYELVASSKKIPAYNLSREEQAIRDFFEKAELGPKEVDEKVGTPKGPKDTSRVSHTGKTEGGSYATKVDPAEAVATKAIDQAGQPPVKKLPTQEDVNQNPKGYTERLKSQDVDTDTKVLDIESED